ncbi:hypothetical protein GOBAR_DD01824 [Gossypium barbadense]|nr:hypothetical protein GOBAR_DD01824 [Gossypium barbadense]
MGDEKTLIAKLEAFIEQMAIRQQSLEEQVTMLSLSVQKTMKGDSEKKTKNRATAEVEERIQTRNTDSTWVGEKMRKFFFGNQRTNEEEKVGLAAFHLLGEALWFNQIEEEEANLNWGHFKECCHVRFGPPMSNNPLGELANLRQTGAV